MFRSKRSRDQHLQTHSNKDDLVRLSMRQRLGLQPPQVHIHQHTQMHSSQVQPSVKRPTGVEPTFGKANDGEPDPGVSLEPEPKGSIYTSELVEGPAPDYGMFSEGLSPNNIYGSNLQHLEINLLQHLLLAPPQPYSRGLGRSLSLSGASAEKSIA
ncbi:hypothetical protein ACFE04_023095 [Oxalis oulophora]